MAREGIVRFRVSAEERASIEARAGAARMSLSNYLRSRALETGSERETRMAREISRLRDLLGEVERAARGDEAAEA